MRCHLSPRGRRYTSELPKRYTKPSSTLDPLSTSKTTMTSSPASQRSHQSVCSTNQILVQLMLTLTAYSKYLIFRAIPMNSLLWGCEAWSLRKSLLMKLEVFLTRNILSPRTKFEPDTHLHKLFFSSRIWMPCHISDIVTRG